MDSGNSPDEEVVNAIQGALEECNIIEKPTRENINLLLQQYMLSHIIFGRASFLNEIRAGIKSTGFFTFIQECEYLWPDIFPRQESYCYTAECVARKLVVTGANSVHVREILIGFLNTLG